MLKSQSAERRTTPLPKPESNAAESIQSDLSPSASHVREQANKIAQWLNRRHYKKSVRREYGLTMASREPGSDARVNLADYTNRLATDSSSSNRDVAKAATELLNREHKIADFEESIDGAKSFLRRMGRSAAHALEFRPQAITQLDKSVEEDPNEALPHLHGPTSDAIIARWKRERAEKDELWANGETAANHSPNLRQRIGAAATRLFSRRPDAAPADTQDDILANNRIINSESASFFQANYSKEKRGEREESWQKAYDLRYGKPRETADKVAMLEEQLHDAKKNHRAAKKAAKK